MLKRIITGLALFVVFVLMVVFDYPINWLAIFVVIAVGWGTLEFYRATKVTKSPVLTFFGIAASCLIALSPLLNDAHLYILAAFVLLSLSWLVLRGKNEDTGLWQWTLAGVIYIGFMLSYVLATRELDQGIGWVFLIAFTTFTSDVFAYFTGTLWRGKKHALAPNISPKKTVEGAVGGLVGAIVLAIIVSTVAGLPIHWLGAALFGLVISVLAILGDLVESRLKRYAQIKDASDALPGHGGALDRLDSLIFTFVAGYYIITIFIL